MKTWRSLPDWVKGCLVWGGLLLFGWALVLLLGYIILRGILAFLNLYED